MFKNKGIWLILALLLVYFFVSVQETGQTDWRASYSSKDKIPFGCYLLFEEMGQLFPGKNIETQDEPYINYMAKNAGGAPKNILLVSDDIDLGKVELDMLLDFVGEGNTAFLSAGSFGKKFERTFNYRVFYDNFQIMDTVLETYHILNRKKGISYHFSAGDATRYFYLDTSFKGHVLGLKGEGKPVYLKIPHKKGHIFLHLYPQLLTNYQWLKNPQYAAEVFSFLPKNTLWWDEFHKPFRMEGKDHLDYVRNTRQLRWAWALFYSGCVLLLVFLAKRKQRPVEVITTPANDSLEFIETVGNLYLQEKNDLDIAQKRVRYFYHSVRKQFNLGEQDEDFWKRLSSKSAWSAEEAAKLRELINSMETMKKPGRDFLLELNRLIDNYYKSINEYKP